MYDESKYAAARNDPEIREISLAEAQDLLKKTDAEIARSVLELTYPFQHLLPEHRALLLPRVASYLAEKGSASTGLSVLAHGERSGEKILAVAATLKELAEKKQNLKGKLEEAANTGDRRRVRHLLEENILSQWFLAEVLEPFLLSYAVRLDELGLDPEVIRAKALSHKSFRARHADPDGVVASHVLDSGEQPAIVGAPALPNETIDNSGNAWSATINIGGRDVDGPGLIEVMDVVSQQAGADSVTGLCNQYTSLAGLWDHIERAVEADLTVPFAIPGDLQNPLLAAGAGHPLSTAFEVASRHRRKIVDALNSRAEWKEEAINLLSRNGELANRFKTDTEALTEGVSVDVDNQKQEAPIATSEVAVAAGGPPGLAPAVRQGQSLRPAIDHGSSPTGVSPSIGITAPKTPPLAAPVNTDHQMSGRPVPLVDTIPARRVTKPTKDAEALKSKRRARKSYQPSLKPRKSALSRFMLTGSIGVLGALIITGSLVARERFLSQQGIRWVVVADIGKPVPAFATADEARHSAFRPDATPILSSHDKYLAAKWDGDVVLLATKSHGSNGVVEYRWVRRDMIRVIQYDSNGLK